MRKLISFVHISLDGFVAGPNGEMDWIKMDQELFTHVENRIKLTDTAMYGRATYEMMEAYWPFATQKENPTQHDIEHSKWYMQSKKLVISNSLQNDEKLNRKVIQSKDIITSINSIKQNEGSEILVFGSPSATHLLLENKLIDGFWLFVNPVILGKGISLYQNIDDKMNLELLNYHQFQSGVMELNYVSKYNNPIQQNK